MPQLDLGKVVGDTGPQGPKGDQGIQGPAGQTGPGVAVGGSANQVLVKHSGTNYDTQWVDAGNLPSIAGVQDSIAIVANGDTHPAIASGQFVYVRNHSTLAEGLYKATAAIGTDVALTTSNLTADGSGGLNDLKGQIDSLNSKLTGRYIFGSEDLDTYYGSDKTGIYNIGGTAPANCPTIWAQLFVNSIQNGATQILVSDDYIYTRRRTGNPSTWLDWKKVFICDQNWVKVQKDGDNSYFKYKVRGSTVTVFCCHKVSSKTIGVWENHILGTIPERYRPTSEDMSVRCMTDRNDGQGCALIIGTNGNVYIAGRWSGASDTTNILYATVTYTI